MPAYNTTAYTVSGPDPELFQVGGDQIEMEAQGCFSFNRIVCCHGRPMLESLSGPRICSQFETAQCCYMIPGQDQHPRLPADLVPLLPTLTSPGQCEQRRRGRRVLHCCRGAEPRDPSPPGKAARICNAVGELRCCYHPFAGVSFAVKMQSKKAGLGLIVTAKNDVEK